MNLILDFNYTKIFQVDRIFGQTKQVDWINFTQSIIRLSENFHNCW